MKTERKRHYAVDKLSAQGRDLVDRLLGENKTYEDIVSALKAETGESLALSSLQRYRQNKWFRTRAALEEVQRSHGLINEWLEKHQGKKLDEVSSELLKHHLFKALSAIQDGDPVKLYDLSLGERRIELEREKVSVSKEKLKLEEKRAEAYARQLAIKERQLEQAREKAVAAEKKVEEIGRRKKLDPDVMRTIKEEIYGIVEPAH